MPLAISHESDVHHLTILRSISSVFSHVVINVTRKKCAHHGGLVKDPLGYKGTSGVSVRPDKTTGRATSDYTLFALDSLTHVSIGDQKTQMRAESF